MTGTNGVRTGIAGDLEASQRLPALQAGEPAI
jgi:hypothetical protein